MDERFERETEGLIHSWMRHDAAMLRDYLVADVEDPRINVQSILTRHFLIEALFGSRFAWAMEQELRFGIVMNWLLKVLKSSGGAEEFPAIRHALQRGADNAEGLPIPHFVSRAFAGLPATSNAMVISNYLAEGLVEPGARTEQPRLADSLLSTFQRIWRELLGKESAASLGVLEPACGSANDYRFLDSFGLAPLLDYTGLDLCEKNIANAKAMFPDARFTVGNALALEAPDQAFEVSFVHDLFEHLSIEAMAVAVSELCRVTARSICAHFFSMHEEDDHVVRRVEEYHWNTLSVAKTREQFARRGFDVQAVHIGTFLKRQFGCEETHNPNAYTFVASRDHGH